MHLIFLSEETNEQSDFDFKLQKVKQNGNMSAFELWLHKADSKCKKSLCAGIFKDVSFNVLYRLILNYIF